MTSTSGIPPQPRNKSSAKPTESNKTEQIELLTIKKDESSLQTTDTSLSKRQISKIKDINNSDDFISWIEKKAESEAKKSEKRLSKSDIIFKKIATSIPLALNIIASVALVSAFVILCVYLQPIAMVIGFASILSILCLLGTSVLVIMLLPVSYFSIYSLSDAQSKALDLMLSSVAQSAIKEILQNEQFSNMTSDEYKELARSISAMFDQEEYMKYRSSLAKNLVDSLSKINVGDDKSKTLDNIAETAKNFIKKTVDGLDKFIKDKNTKEKLTAAKKKFFSQKINMDDSNKLFNKNLPDLNNFLVKYNKTQKKAKDSIQLSPTEIQQAIQKGFDNYFASQNS